MSDIVGQLKGKPLFYYVAETKKSHTKLLNTMNHSCSYVICWLQGAGGNCDKSINLFHILRILSVMKFSC